MLNALTLSIYYSVFIDVLFQWTIARNSKYYEESQNVIHCYNFKSISKKKILIIIFNTKFKILKKGINKNKITNREEYGYINLNLKI